MKDINEKLEHFRLICKDNGLKVTPQRVAVYKALAETVEHPSTEMLFNTIRQEYPNISMDTVNRTLLLFSEMGVAFVVEGSGDSRRYDAGMDSHQHFRCVKCKRIVDFHHEPFDNVYTPEEIPSGFEVLRKTVYFEGYCDKCRG